MIKCYFAGRYSRREELASYAAELRRSGVEVTSQWLAGTHTAASDQGLSADESRMYASEDLDDIDDAGVMVWFGDPPDNRGTRGGASFEAGYAYGIGMPLIVVGHRQSVFAHLPDVVFCETFDAARSYLCGLSVGSNGRVAA